MVNDGDTTGYYPRWRFPGPDERSVWTSEKSSHDDVLPTSVVSCTGCGLSSANIPEDSRATGGLPFRQRHHGAGDGGEVRQVVRSRTWDPKDGSSEQRLVIPAQVAESAVVQEANEVRG